MVSVTRQHECQTASRIAHFIAVVLDPMGDGSEWVSYDANAHHGVGQGALPPSGGPQDGYQPLVLIYVRRPPAGTSGS